MMNHAIYKLNVERARLERLQSKLRKQLQAINRAIQLIEYDATPIDKYTNSFANDGDEGLIELDDLDLVLLSENAPLASPVTPESTIAGWGGNSYPQR